MKWLVYICSLSLLIGASMLVNAQTQRTPVISQIAHPHNYYWREMYLPQLTSGPSSGTFSPDGKSVIYTMQGSLWQQKLTSDTAYQLTNNAGYDFQPDWSPDGNSVIFTRQINNTLNLYLLDNVSGKEYPITQDEAVNVEPRWSPDGKKIAFISSKKDGYWGLYIADVNQQTITNIRPMVAGHVSKRDRYYYSRTDHVINPSWAPDSQHLFYVSNDEVAWGSGDIWSININNPKDKKRVLVEETTWATKPEVSHYGNRLLYSSYAGRQWQQLWLTTTDGLSPLPLTFGDYDLKNARWSPDDSHLLYTSNQTGGLKLWLHTVVGGAKKQIIAHNKIYKSPMQALNIVLKDAAGAPLDGRVILTGANGRQYAPDNSRIHADDYLNPNQSIHETHYFHCYQSCTAMVPSGALTIKVMSGYNHTSSSQSIKIGKIDKLLTISLQDVQLPKQFGHYVSADMHVHMNYGGKYKQTLPLLGKQAKAEGLDVIYNLIVNKEQRIPDISQFKTSQDNIDGVTIYQAQEYHSSYWGHMSFLHLDDHLLSPYFTSYRHTALHSPYPTNSVMIDLAHQQGAVTGYVHPFDNAPDTSDTSSLSNNLPVDVILGKADFIEVVSFADHKETAKIWYKFLNLGYPLAAGAGTDAMTNYSSLRGPVGLNRAFLQADANNPDSLKKAIRAGHSFVTNGPLVGILAKVKSQKEFVGPGERLSLPDIGGVLTVRIALNSYTPVEQLDVVQNGNVIKRIDLAKNAYQATAEIEVPVSSSGWILLRAVNDNANELVQDLYTYATTNPIWFDVKNKPQQAPEDAAYFLSWINRILTSVNMRTDDFNSPWEKNATINNIQQAKSALQEKLHAVN
jgi:Tol biopolymer transport system component